MAEWIDHLPPELCEQVTKSNENWDKGSFTSDDFLLWRGVVFSSARWLLSEGNRRGNADLLRAAIAGTHDSMTRCKNLQLPEHAVTDTTEFLLLIQADALTDLGDMLGEQEYLRTAVSAYNAALRAFDEDETPHQWATIHCNLAIALVTLGERLERAEDLRAAVSACNAALRIFNQQETPNAWASTKCCLGTALSCLGTLLWREDDLREAASAYNAALQVYAREEMASGWAYTQNNLGNVLTSLGQMLWEEHHLRDAVSAFSEALRVFNEDKTPQEWAKAQSNLANALSTLGKMMEREDDLRDAVSACQAALRVFDEEKTPHAWAITQKNLAKALTSRGEMLGRQEDLLAAVSANDAALRVFNEDETPQEWATTQDNLGNALETIGAMLRQEEKYRAAAAAYSAALRIFRPEATPERWEGTIRNLTRIIHLMSSPPLDIVERARTQALEALPHFAAYSQPRQFLRTLYCSLGLGATLSDMGDGLPEQAAAQMRLALRQAGDRDGRRHVLKEVAGLGDRLTCAALREAEDLDQLPLLLDLTRAREMGRRVELSERGMTQAERDSLSELRKQMLDLKRAREAAQARGASADADTCTAELKQIDHAIETLFATVEDRLHLDTSAAVAMSLETVQANLATSGMSALVSLVSDDHGGFVLAVPAEGPLRQQSLSADINAKFDGLLKEWLEAYVASFVRSEPNVEGVPPSLTKEAADAWEAHLQVTLPTLWDAAGRRIAELLADMGLNADSRVGLLLPGRLSILPWEAALGPDAQSLRDHALLSRIPSLAAIASLVIRKDRPAPKTPSVVTITDPRRDLPKEIQRLGNPADAAMSGDHLTALAGEAATLDAVRATFGTATLVSFFLHGSWGGRDAAGSALGLAGTDLLTALDIGEGDLPNCETIVIGACASGNIALEAADEFDGLPTAFFSAGASSVIATLWPVYVTPTHQTLTRLFDAMKAGVAPNAALRTALTSANKPQEHDRTTAGLDNADPDRIQSRASSVPEALPDTLYPLSTTAAFFTFGK